MPTIKINEQDLSWYYRQRQPGQLTVLMPGVASFGPCSANEGSLALVNEDNFTKTLGTSSVDSLDLSYHMAKSFVKSGIDVLFWRVPLPGMAYSSYNFSRDEGGEYTATATEGQVEYVVPGDGKAITITKFELGSTTVSAKDYETEAVETGLKVTYTGSATIEAGTAVKITYSTTVPVLTVRAKYAGDFGDTLSVKAVSAGTNIYRFLIYSTAGTNTALLETLLVNFTDMDNEYYYDTVNRTSSYIEFEPTEEAIASFLPVSDRSYPLGGGSNGTYSVEAVTDYLSGAESDNVFNELADPLSHVFNIVINSGYNNYGRFLFDKHVTATEATAGKVEISIKGVTPAASDIKVYAKGTELAASGYTYDTTNKKVTIQNSAAYTIAEDDYIEVVVSKTTVGNISQIDDRFIGLCESTGLATYLVDGAQSWSAEEFYNYTDLPTDSSGESGVYSSHGFNTSYAAAIGPWCSAVLVSNGVTRMLPGSYVLLVQWAQSLATGVPMYYAPSGVKRASLNFVSSTAYPVGSGVLELWQNQDMTVTNGHKIIPIANIRQYGYVIYGNSTLLKNLANGSTSMLQSLSTRILANMIKARAFDISLSLQFDQISKDLFIEFRSLLSEFMDELLYNNALFDYQIEADMSTLTLDDLNSKTVPVKIRISPTPAAENFIIDLEISQAGITFNSESLEIEEG